jgi:pyrroline-5-carboxylate reductase
MSKKIAFVGTGNMGGGHLRGLLHSGYSAKDITFFELLMQRQIPLQHSDLNALLILNLWYKRQTLSSFALNPQIFKTAATDWSHILEKLSSTPVYNFHYGRSIAKNTSDSLGNKLSVFRVMPNLPLTVGKGTVAIATDSITEENLVLTESLFAPVGVTVRVPESLMDAVTGLSGSAPAYVFEFIEGLVRGGVRMGLSRPVAMQLALGTIEGSVEMVKKTKQDPGTLCAMVCSPAGTTIAGVQALEDGAFKGTLMHAVEAATKRSRELG